MRILTVSIAAILLGWQGPLPVSVVYAQTELYNYCGEKQCIESTTIPCEEMIETYRFQGSCCSMTYVPQTKGCRITVSYGNCYWDPWCAADHEGECDGQHPSRCGNVFETNANQRPCPVGDYDPLAIQAAVDWYPPSCAPSMAPTNRTEAESSPAVYFSFSTTLLQRLLFIVSTIVVSTSVFFIA